MVSSRKESNAEALAALGTTTRQNLAAILGCHACTEAVYTLALQVAGLESAFHRKNPVVSCSRPRIVGSLVVGVNESQVLGPVSFIHSANKLKFQGETRKELIIKFF